MTIPFLDALLRLVAAAVLSGFIGFEREAARKPAGLRTHMLVGLGSALFAIVSMVSFGALDPSRIAAQVVTGVGFLGAGAIFREGQFVRGLTTAAGLWTVAAIGLAAGAGDLGLAAVATGVALTVLLVVGFVEDRFSHRIGATVKLTVYVSDLDQLGKVTQFAGRVDPSIEQVGFERIADERMGCLILQVTPDRAAMVAEMLATLDGVDRVEKE
jgi:putative Mg2+ transporter-C (MgtC) family protein